MVEAVTGVPAQRPGQASEEFTRVVLEVPVRSQLPLPPLPEPFAGGVGHSLKHPSGLPALAERLHKLQPDGMNGSGAGPSNGAVAPSVPRTFVRDLAAQDFSKIETPSWIFLDTTAADTFN